MSESRLPIHLYAQLFPALSSAEFDVLCGSILLHGLLEDIVLHEGQILDGKYRYLACLAKGMTPRAVHYARWIGGNPTGGRFRQRRIHSSTNVRRSSSPLPPPPVA